MGVDLRAKCSKFSRQQLVRQLCFITAENAHDVTEIVSQLAAQQLIRPTTTQGHIGDVLKDKIVYDAATTVGGSGGPLFDRDGKVIGVNSAILEDFGGSNLAVPVRYAEELMK
jgi:serine protease Do